MPELSERDIPPALLRELPRLKQIHPHIYAVKTEGGVFAIRPLTWAEFKTAKEKVYRDLLPEVFIVGIGLVWPDKIPDKAPAGVIHTLASTIINASGFENPVALNSALAQADYDIANDPNHIMVMAICKAFPAYKPEDLYALPFIDLTLRFKMAEKMLGWDANMAAQANQPVPRRVRREQRAPMVEIGNDEPMVFGPDEEFEPVPVSGNRPGDPGYDPLRDPNLPPPNFEADNKFFRREFTNYLTRIPHPGEA